MLALRDLLISSDPLARRRPGFVAGDKLIESWPKGKCSMEVNSSPSAWKRWTRPTLERPPYELEGVVLWGDLQLFVCLIWARGGTLEHHTRRFDHVRSIESQQFDDETQPPTRPVGTSGMPVATSFWLGGSWGMHTGERSKRRMK
jgi:hypothetical protein